MDRQRIIEKARDLRAHRYSDSTSAISIEINELVRVVAEEVAQAVYQEVLMEPDPEGGKQFVKDYELIGLI